MSSDQAGSETSTRSEPVKAGEIKLEVVVIPVSDVDRAKQFYESLGWRLDADLAVDDSYRVVQLTPPGSACSIIFGAKAWQNKNALSTLIAIVRRQSSSVISES